MSPISRLHDLLTERFTAPDLRLLVTFDEGLAAAGLGAVVNFDRSVRQVAFDLVAAASQRNLLPALAAAAARARPQVPEAAELARLFSADNGKQGPDDAGRTDPGLETSPPALLAAPCFRILVTGTGVESSFTAALRQQSTDLGERLAAGEFGLVTGGWPGVDETVARSFAETLSGRRIDLEDRLTQVVVRNDVPRFPGGQLMFVRRGKEEWSVPIDLSDAVVLLGGLGGTETTGKMAWEARKPVLPLADTQDDAMRIYLAMIRDWDRFAWMGIEKAKFQRLARPAHQAIDAAIDLLTELRRLAGRSIHSPETDASPPRRPVTLSGPARIFIRAGLVSRWVDLADYFGVPLPDREACRQADSPPGRLLDWLEERKKLPALRDAFSALGWEDLIEILNRPQ